MTALRQVARKGMGWLLSAREVLERRPCPACGERSAITGGPVLWPELIAQWELSPAWVRHIDEREGLRCAACDANLRSRHLAQGLLVAAREMAGVNSRSLKALCADPRFRALSIAEINAAGGLHRFLAELPRLRYSEYRSTLPAVPSEDLLALSYADATFDLVITSESLEHVPDMQRALGEIRRVLKPGGRHVFTVPVVWDRPRSRRRASLSDGELIHHLPPSYHGAATTDTSDLLVFHEFGRDFVDQCTAAGFAVRVLRDQRNPALLTFLTVTTG